LLNGTSSGVSRDLKHEIQVTNTPEDEDVQRVLSGLREYNRSHVKSDINDIGIFVRDQGQIIAGLYGTSMWDWLHIKYLWVTSDHRKQGLGSELMSLAEEEAQKRRCIGLHLDTFSFQALDFYLGLGFEVFGEIEDHPEGGRRYFLSKRI
jgi:ribosomal protein S18 acetylase RimI-like enzyme